jgi:hypothetical protein
MAAVGLPRFATYCSTFRETETYRVQEKHLPVYHALCAMIEEAMFGGDRG